ncbi:MAG: hypothetical protein VX036_02860, partial [Pseudomonadota bacterium]|nr:hypothetical protein [Pseudomonadota bacterium]
DGSSNYYLNSTRCRRKDIREVFLGTGLGPRSYAIIEQGMISRLVEAKPEELRTYLEEAALISKYKEKRRETEIRLKHTKENLNRLNDVMKEITSQLNKLERQAKSANIYTELKSKERDYKLKLLAIKWNDLSNELDSISKDKSANEIELEKYNASITNKEKGVEILREKINDEQNTFSRIQSEFYSIGSDIAKCEKDIEHSQKTESSRQKAIEEMSQDIEKINKEISDNLGKSEDFDNKIKLLYQDLENLAQDLEKNNKEKDDANFAVQNWQTKYNEFISNQLETVKELEVENTRIEASSKSLALLNKRLNILESQNLDDENKDDKSEIIKQAKDIQEKLSSTLVDIDRSDLKNYNNKAYKNIPISIREIFDTFKILYKRIQNLVISQKYEIKDIKAKIIDYEKTIHNSNEAIKAIEIRIEQDKKEKIKLEKQKVEFKQIADSIAWKIEEKHQQENDLNMKSSSLEAERNSLVSNVDRMRAQVKGLENKKLSMLSESDSDDLPVTDMKSELSNLLDVKRHKEEELAQSRTKLDSYDQEIMLFEQQKNELIQKTEEYKNEIEKLKLSYTEKNTQKNSLMENSEFVKSDIEKAISEYMEDQIYDKVEKSLIEIQNKIESMGAINLAAIDELSDQNERKKYLDEQYEDLSSSVSTLENAIKKIDSETKSKFKDMFDNINSNLNSFFTKIFGGGKAYLELTDNDLLSTGVKIMARPPGKLVKNINLLSGGEKAGTGIAFVFSIFKSNPAPFCLLDEVDAPLDDANNSRFCSVVREMSESVQFIFITHNKLTMELADILNGVTMREAGISKMVTVNVNDAIKLAETQPNSSVQDRPS